MRTWIIISITIVMTLLFSFSVVTSARADHPSFDQKLGTLCLYGDFDQETWGNMPSDGKITFVIVSTQSIVDIVATRKVWAYREKHPEDSKNISFVAELIATRQFAYQSFFNENTPREIMNWITLQFAKPKYFKATAQELLRFFFYKDERTRNWLLE